MLKHIRFHINRQDPKMMTVYVPGEESLWSYTTLEQTVVMELRELEVKNPTIKTIDEMVERIMDGTPGSELDKSLLKMDGSDTVIQSLTGGKSLMETPMALKEDAFSFAEFVSTELEEQAAKTADDPGLEPEGEKKKDPDANKDSSATVDSGELLKEKTKRALALDTLLSSAYGALSVAKEKLKECEGPSMEKMFERWPSLNEMMLLLKFRTSLLETCLPKARDKKELECLGGKQGVHPDKIPLREDVVEKIEEAKMSVQNVFGNLDALKSWDELALAEKGLGGDLQPVNTQHDLEAAKKALATMQDPLKALTESTKTQATRLSQAKAQVSKQYLKETEPEASGLQPVQPKKSSKAAGGGDHHGIFAAIPGPYEVKMPSIDYKNASWKSALQAVLQDGKPCVLINAPQPHQLQQAGELRLHLLLFKASATNKCDTFLAEGHVVQPLGGGKPGKTKLRKELVEQLLGQGAALDLATDEGLPAGDKGPPAGAPVADMNEFFVSATKEKTETMTTEFCQMGSVHCVLSGQVQTVLVDFVQLSKFAAMAEGATDKGLGEPDKGLSAHPMLHPTKVVDFVKDNIKSKEVLHECGAFGVHFYTATLQTNHVMIVPPGYIKAQRPEPSKGTAMILATPILSKFCAARASAYDFIKESVKKFQNPNPDHPLWRLMMQCAATLTAYSQSQPPTGEKAPPLTPQKTGGVPPPADGETPEKDCEQSRVDNVDPMVKAYFKASSQSREEAVLALRGIVSCFPKTVDTRGVTVEVD